MKCRVDTIIAKVCPPLINPDKVSHAFKKVHEYHRKYFEEGKGTRDVLIVAHGHFNRVFIARWVEFPLCLGKCLQLCLCS